MTFWRIESHDTTRKARPYDDIKRTSVDAGSAIADHFADVSKMLPEPVGRRIRLGEIQAALAPIQITADGLAHFGFQPVGKDGAAKLYDAAAFQDICNEIITRVRAAKDKGV